MKIALVYDRVNKWGGAERVLLALHEIFPEAPLYTSVYNPLTAPWAKVFQIKWSFLQKFPYASSAHEYYPLLMPLAFESLDFSEYDLVISVTSEAAKGILTSPQTKHICYCLTPTRYLWSGYGEYFKNSFFKLISAPAVWYLRTWDTVASSRPDVYIAISKEVQQRIKKYYSRKSFLLYPPVDIKSLTMQKRRSPTQKDYFLVVSRLVPYKRVDLAIHACNELKSPLIIVGTGSEEKKLKKIAGPTIKFVGAVSERKLISYYEHCTAFIFPGREDFGITAVEAQACGKPVIAYGKGGVSETVINGRTGIHFSKQTVESLKEAIEKFSKLRYNSQICQKQAALFSKKQFTKQLLFLLKNIL